MSLHGENPTTGRMGMPPKENAFMIVKVSPEEPH